MQLLALIFAHISTRNLLSLASISHHFSRHVLLSYQARLTRAASLDGHSLILECYPPSNKLSTSYLHCDYTHTPGLADRPHDSLRDPAARLRALRALYSHFTLRSQEPPGPSAPAQRRPGDIPGSRTYEGYDALDWVDGDGTAEKIHLDAGELFSQLCCVTNLVKMDPKRFLPLSIVRVSDGMIRVFRDWLARVASEREVVAGDASEYVWVNNCDGAVGLKLLVRQVCAEGGSAAQGCTVATNDEVPVTYVVECKGKVTSETEGVDLVSYPSC